MDLLVKRKVSPKVLLFFDMAGGKTSPDGNIKQLLDKLSAKVVYF